MKENIFTIPLIDAFKSQSECPFCYLFQNLEQESVEFMLGASYMEDDIRMETNKIGFCTHHYSLMYEQNNRLGLALMLHTHMKSINQNLEQLLASKKSLQSPHKTSLLEKLTRKSKYSPSNDTPISAFLTTTIDNCYICNKINSTLNRYIDTFFYLWKKDSSFRNIIANTSGFCLTHFSMLLDQAPQKLSKKTLDDLYECIIPLQLKNLQRIEDDLDWFIKKYDYRFNNEPWKNAKDSIPRAITKVASITLEK